MSATNFTELITKIDKMAQELSHDSNFVNPMFIQTFQEQCRRAKSNAEDIMNIDRDMKVGIVGQVKAGKSSFLNAMIFNGDDILPKAATPMTAALTKIVYSENQYAKVVFYSKNDWEVIEEASDNYGTAYNNLLDDLEAQKRNTWERKRQAGLVVGEFRFSPTEMEKAQIINQILPQYTACRELTDMAESKSDILNKLDKEEEISINNLNSDLENYVGAKGKYTPIVKYIELGINNPLVKNLEIIDTPGLGDPILSRSQKTKEFLMQCDLVFVLSTTSQFMNQEDIQFIMKTLPSESINHAVIVGSKFDSAMLDNPSRKRCNIKLVAKETIVKLNRTAKNHIEQALKSNIGYSGALVLQRLKDSLPPEDKPLKTPPYYISSILYGAAKNIINNKPLSEEEALVISNLISRFEGMQKIPQFLIDWAGIDELKTEEFKKIHQERQNIIAEKGEEFVKAQKITFLRQLDDIQTEAEQNLQTIKTTDIGDLQKKLDISQKALASMKKQIKSDFENCAIDAEKYLVKLSNDVKSIVKNYTTINIGERIENIERSRKEGWWIFGSTKYWTETKHHNTATIQDVINNVNSYIDDAENNIGRNLEKAIDINIVKNKIRDTVLQAFQKSDTNFDPNDILGPLNNLLARLTVPPFNVVDRAKYRQMIEDKFSQSYVEDENIHILVKEQGTVLNTVSSDISAVLQKISNDIKDILNEKAVTFNDDVKTEIEEKIKLLESNLHNKEESINNYKDFLNKLKHYKDELRTH